MGSSPGASSSFKSKKLKPHRAPFERRVNRFALFLVAPALIVSAILIWRQPWPLGSKFLLFGTESFACFLIGLALHDHVVRPLQTLANVVGALRDEDYSFRARLAVPNDALGELSLEVNALADLLAQHRTGAIEAAALLQRVVEEVEIPIFAFDPAARLRLLNSAGEKLLQQPSILLLGRTASELRLDTSLSCENETLIQLQFGTAARWFVRRSAFRQQGIPHTLVVLSDVSRALREEERRAWQRLIRVMGHELNNSLAPIKSIAGSLNARLSGIDLGIQERQDFERGLGIIESRAASLNRFLQAYRQLAQMPPPALKKCSLSVVARRITAMEPRVPVALIPGPTVSLMADPDQLEQMLINLLRNAADAVLESAAGNSNGFKHSFEEPNVELTWKLNGSEVVLTIDDNGPGLMNPANVFVPFYTTKPSGSGIGLVLSRQIAEAHGGSLELSNRTERRGCRVTVTLPLRRTVEFNVDE
jgi:two-component system, NtrC family, nitrogen regulation sensor histidine kinase NtrY